MLALEILLVALAFLGSAALWVKLFNNLHARNLPCWMIRWISILCYAGVALSPVLLAVWYWQRGETLIDQIVAVRFSLPLTYVGICWAAVAWSAARFFSKSDIDSPQVLLTNQTTNVDVLGELKCDYDGPKWITALARIPGNELLDLTVHEKTLRIPRLPAALEGFSIAHLSDLHFTGKVGKAWFEDVIERANGFDTDIVAVTGDLFDKAACFEWIPDTFGRLRGRHGVFFVLGNHDKRLNSRRMRQLLVEANLVDLGGRPFQFDVNDSQIILAGNELPWFAPAADMSDCPPRHDAQLRIGLSHSPDQIDWARHLGFDLMLAGHTHGGQIRLPIIGPVVSPSRYGTRYASGTFYEPPTVMHVSRGLSGTTPVRYHCPPELTKLVLTAQSR